MYVAFCGKCDKISFKLYVISGSEDYMFDLSDLIIAMLTTIIASLALLPITSDQIRNKLFAGKAKAISEAKQELLSACEGIIFSNQELDDLTFQKLEEGIAYKYNIDSTSMGTKDYYLAIILQLVNTTVALPSSQKKVISNYIKIQLDSQELDNTISNQKLSEVSASDSQLESVGKLISDGHEQNQSYFEYPYTDKPNHLYTYPLSFIISLIIGLILGILVCLSENIFTFRMVLCALSLILCINIITALVDSRIAKNYDFYGQLIRKIILLMVIIMLIIISLLSKWPFLQ